MFCIFITCTYCYNVRLSLSIPHRRYLRSAVPDLFMSTPVRVFGSFIVLTSLSNGRSSLPCLVFCSWFQCPLSVIQFRWVGVSVCFSIKYVWLGLVKPRSHSTPRLNHVQKVIKIWWTWSCVVILGQFLAWPCFVRGMAVGGCSTAEALPKHG